MQSSAEIQVLVVHEDPLVSAGLAATLAQQEGFQVKLGMPPLEPPQPSDVVVADYEQGLDLIAIARQHPRAQHLGLPKVLIVTHCESEWEVRNALERGARGYLLQNCKVEEVVEGVRALHRGVRHLSAEVTQCMADSLTRERLTSRETDVLRLMAQGQGNKLIAKQLNIAVGTVKTHVKGILGKLDAACRTEAAAVADRRGLLRAAAHQGGAETSITH
jgi:DNA-binding NarL/FixJ family response regulator